MSDIKAWSPNANENNAAAPHGAAEGMPVSSVNDTMREMMAAVRRQFEQAGFFDPGYTPTRLADDKFTLTDDRTSVFLVGQRVKFSDGVVKYGTITASEYTTLTTVTVSLDDSGTLSASLSAVAVGISPDAVKEPPVVPVATTDQAGTVELATVEELHTGEVGKIADAAQIKALLDARDARDARLFFQQAAQQNLDRQSFGAGILDVFTDETDVDTVGSSMIYNSASDSYTSSSGEVPVGQNVGTPIGNMTQRGGLAGAFNGNENESFATAANAPGNAPATIGKDFGAGVTKAISRVECISVNGSLGFKISSNGTITLKLYGTTDGTATGGTLIQTIGPFADLDGSGGIISRTFTLSSPVSFRSFYVEMTSSDTQTSRTFNMGEMKFHEEVISGNAVLHSNAFAANSVPDRLDAFMWHEALENIALNADVILSISRDSGNTWTAATLVKDSDMATGQLLRASGVDVSGQPSGTQIKYKVEFNNNKAQRLHGVSLQWG